MRQFLSLLLVILLSLPSYAAIAPATQWEVRTTGASTNGGGYSSGGFDYSLQATPVVSVTNAVTAGTAVITSSTASFPADLPGNVCYVSGGTGSITAARYQVVTRDSATQITVDRSTGLTTGTGVTLICGGSARDISDISPSTNPSAVAGNIIHVQKGTYVKTATTTLAVVGTSGAPVIVRGYSDTRGDGATNGRPIIQLNGTTLTGLNITGAMTRVMNIDIDANNQNASRGVTLGGAQSELYDVNVYSSTGTGKTHGISFAANGLKAINCSVRNFEGTPVLVSSGQVLAHNLWVRGNSAPGVTVATGIIMMNGGGIVFNTGASSDGVQITGTATSTGAWLNGMVIWGNGRDGVRATADGSGNGLSILNTVIGNNAGYQINIDLNDWSSSILMANHNGLYQGSGTGLRRNFPSGLNSVTLTGDPFVDSAGGNFTLNNTSGAGAALKGVGFPGVSSYGGTGYMDIGPFQSQCTGGPGVGLCASPIMQ